MMNITVYLICSSAIFYITDGLTDCCNVVTMGTVIKVNCSGCRLQIVPGDFPINVSELNLHNNNLTVLHKDSFRYLHQLNQLILSSNGLSFISSGAFNGLKNLKYLDLSNNLLDNASFDGFTFQPLVDLINLNLKQNRFHLKKTYPEHALPYLSHIKTLQIDGFEGFHFGIGFLKLNKLQHIDLNMVMHERISILNTTFVGLKQTVISHLELHFPIKQIEINALSPFRNLVSLKLDSERTMNIRDVLKLLYGLQNRKLQYLSLTGNNFRYGSGVVLMKTDFVYLRTICVRKLDLSSNDIDGIDMAAVLSWSSRKCLEILDLSSNGINSPQFLTFLVLFPSITHVYASNQRSQKVRKHSVAFKTQLTFYLPHSLIYLNISRISVSGPLQNMTFHKSNNLKVFDLSYPRKHPSCSYGRIRGLVHLTEFYISGTECSEPNSEMFADMFYLSTLEAKQCNVGNVLAKNNSLLFKGRSNITSLDLSANSIHSMSSNLFVDQQDSLKRLVIASNKLESLQTNILVKLHALETLDVSHNLISTLTESDRIFIDTYQKLSSKFKLNLFGNPLVCSCEVLDFLDWVGTTYTLYNKDDLSCNAPNGSQVKMMMFLQSFDQFKESCASQFWLVISLIMSIALIITAFLFRMVWRHSVRLRVWCRQPLENDVFPFDVFINYCYEDTTWVARTLVPMLEQENIEYCIDDKDFDAGLDRSDNIMNAIDNSRKSVFVVSCNYFKNEWQTFTMKLTSVYSFRDGRENMNIIILLNDMKRSEFPKLIRKNWDEISPIKWPDDSNVDGSKLNLARKIFWKKLLKRIKKQNIDKDEHSFSETAL